METYHRMVRDADGSATVARRLASRIEFAVTLILYKHRKSSSSVNLDDVDTQNCSTYFKSPGSDVASVVRAHIISSSVEPPRQRDDRFGVETQPIWELK